MAQFIASHHSTPAGLVLDIDASDIPLHGDQELREFHGYYDHHCYLPLYVFCGEALLACYLRRTRIDGAKNATALISLLIQRLRQAWPDVPIIVRGDSGFCRQGLMRRCERHAVSYALGMARNARLEAIVSMTELALAEQYAATGMKQREVGEFSYAADSWDRERLVITRLEYGSQGNNPRFVVTNVQGEAAALYDQLYCQRGEAENRIKETQLDLFGTRASCHKFLANQFRLLLAALAYTLMQRLRTLALRARTWPTPARLLSERGCSRSLWVYYATPVAFASCSLAIIHCASCSRWLPQDWLRPRPKPPLGAVPGTP